MPLKKPRKGSSVKVKRSVASANIREMHKSKTYKATLGKFGAKTANRQAVAAGLTAAGLIKKKKKGSK